MNRPPRPRGEGVITRRMWVGILFVGLVMAAGTLLVLDASLPGGLIEGTGTMRYGQTMTFTTLMMFQLFNALKARSDEESAFCGLFRNRWLRAATASSVFLHAAVVFAGCSQWARCSRRGAVATRSVTRRSLIRRSERSVRYSGDTRSGWRPIACWTPTAGHGSAQ